MPKELQLLIACVIAYLLWQPEKEARVFAAETVVVDAGHGGADGLKLLLLARREQGVLDEGDEVGVARACTHNLDVALLVP